MSLGTFKGIGSNSGHCQAYYTLNNTANDASGYGKNMSNGGSPTYITTVGKFNSYGLNIDATTEYLHYDTAFLTMANGFSFGIWFRPSAAPAAGEYQDIVDIRTIVNGHSLFNLLYTKTSATFQIGWRMGGITLYKSTCTLSTGVNHLIGINFGTTNFTIYVDGVPIEGPTAIGTYSNGDTQFKLGIIAGYANSSTNNFSEAFLTTDLTTDGWWRRYYACAQGKLI